MFLSLLVQNRNKATSKRCESYNYSQEWWWNTSYEAAYPALTMFLPSLQVANGGRYDSPKGVGVIANKYLFCSRERWSFGKALYYIFVAHKSVTDSNVE
jgi:hypothetical protein